MGLNPKYYTRKNQKLSNSKDEDPNNQSAPQ